MDNLSQESRLTPNLFAGALGLGVLVQTITSLIVYYFVGDGFLSVLPAAFAILVMFVYLHLSERKTPIHYKTGDFADGFYYLGFLFTLWSLIVSLMVMGVFDVGGEGNQFLLSQFGLALVTTVFGLAGKLYLGLQHGSTPESLDDLVDEAKRSILATRTAGDAYRKMMNEVTGQTRSTLNQGTETLKATLDQMKAPLKNALKGLVDELEGVNEEVRASHLELTDAVHGIGAKLASSVSELTDALDSAQRESSKLGPLFPELQSGLYRLTEEFGSLSKEVVSSKDSFGQLMGESTQLLSTSAETVARASESLEKVTRTMLAAADEGGEAMKQRMDEATRAMAAYTGTLKEATGAVEEAAVRPLKEAAQAQREYQESFIETMKEASKSIDELTVSFKGLAEGERLAQEELHKTHIELVTAVKALRDELED
jgi:hypothetical protein